MLEILLRFPPASGLPQGQSEVWSSQFPFLFYSQILDSWWIPAPPGILTGMIHRGTLSLSPSAHMAPRLPSTVHFLFSGILLAHPTFCFLPRRIRAGTELTWDYNYEVGSVEGKELLCCCGAIDCRGRLL